MTAIDLSVLLNQLMMAIYATAVIVPTIQKVKIWFPAKYVEICSALVSVLIGFLMAWYYGKFDWVASLWVGFFAMIGAEGIYNVLKDKLKTYTEKTEPLVEPIDEPLMDEPTDIDNGLG